MGIFGYLSKAHLDQAIPTGDVAAKLALIDEKIKTEKENLNASRKELNQLDQQVDQTISRTDDAKGTERAITIRRSQQKDRSRILNEIGNAQSKIAKLNEERAPIASEVRKVEAEVGPIKYIAQLIYGQEAQDADFLEKAVRIVILMIVAVFDPLAVLLLVAANWQLRKERGDIVVEEKPPINWNSFFQKKPVEDFPEKKEIVIDDNVVVKEKQEISKEIEPETDLIFAGYETDEVVEKKDWEPELYKRMTPPEKELGRYESELLEQEKQKRVRSFLGKIGEIEKEVDDLNKKKEIGRAHV